ncbi:MAG: molybdenum cofactor guanylyltransferase [Polyangiales bacterium]
MLQLGIFVGGASSRMGQPKGLLRYEGGTLLDRALTLAEALSLEPVLVGDASPYEGHAPGVLRCPDEVLNVGALGGLLSLLRRGPALVMACDMPLLQPSHLQTLLDAPRGLIALSRTEAFYDPFPARCAPELRGPIESQLAQGKTSFQSLIRALEPHERVLVELPRDATLDWDEPSDVFEEPPER